MQFDSANKPSGINRVVLAFKNSQRAFKWLAKNEAAFKQELFLLALSLIIISIWQIGIYEKVMLLISVLFVIFAEVVNTAIEATIDRVGLEIHPLSGLAKDLGSAAVLIALLISSFVWISVFISYIGYF
ncbi:MULTISPECIES: diacylglycerol kinase [Pseudoalteromonas]|jgi:diacylglycerol kinase (ATP)|uniref:Diacylglycerol kinase n=4 Tax=Pseudoalteromonas TaxID=53246 RepID=A0A244CS00_PSEDV|nr:MULTISPECIES: diacylglycerol kinase [Pseudoalteromonas]HCP96537.1 diacylglycerol kinase [Pseudoalteromonas sp.]ASM54308.1 diacylglycerol kinase (ATP dependent) [Pseudoalteromonas nigrifaciens]AUL72985.1 diacylglycerol kinase [Pseudoalteromonas sp. 13-15]MDC9498640.1 diacylglycerol kinase [Pseudoalteromonas sp. Angola-20]MDC9518444.1 diacylglycerol kinase [Pseudoalteromonas sp. Angola-22]|tara:strand:+ start:56888 stop:57274 length:387 start_codon:yes stop_codon:yes gene_type:complete